MKFDLVDSSRFERYIDEQRVIINDLHRRINELKRLVFLMQDRLSILEGVLDVKELKDTAKSI